MSGDTPSFSKRAVSEAVGTALLLATVVGSGIMGERLAGGNVAIALLANSLATGAVLVALIYSLAPISGAHLNPAVSAASAVAGELPWRELPGYIAAQVLGALIGVVLAHLMFDLPAISISVHARAGVGQLLSEVVATFGLVLVIGRCASTQDPVAIAVGAYITAAYWFTASTSFANPAVTLARSLSDTFAGIRPIDAPGFIAAELVGAGGAAVVLRWFAAPARERPRKDVADAQTPRAVSLHR
jgi:glycerol uptake facilitator-like aquaporin